MATPTAGQLARERFAILGVLVALASLAWIFVIWQATTMSGARMASGMAAPAGLTMGMSAALFLAVWVAMMVAMMFPSAAPMVLMFRAIATGKRARGQNYTPTWIFVAGYLLVWSLAGVAAYLAALGLDTLASNIRPLAENAGRIGGSLLVVAGVYQFSPLKNVCLAKCRTPTQFLMTGWRNGNGGAFCMGFTHGVFCLGCCWLLFVILFPLGMMNIAALALLSVLIFVEKTLPVGRLVASLTGVALIGYGLLVVFVPTLLPGTM
jgi:predicted metal-binding membrane protein